MQARQTSGDHERAQKFDEDISRLLAQLVEFDSAVDLYVYTATEKRIGYVLSHRLAPTGGCCAFQCELTRLTLPTGPPSNS